MQEGGFYFIFLLPSLEKKFVSDFAVVKKVMREGKFSLSLAGPKSNQQQYVPVTVYFFLNY